MDDDEHDGAEEGEQAARHVHRQPHAAAHVDRARHAAAARLQRPLRRRRPARPLPLAVLHGDDGPHRREHRQEAEDGQGQLPAVEPI